MWFCVHVVVVVLGAVFLCDNFHCMTGISAAILLRVLCTFYA